MVFFLSLVCRSGKLTLRKVILMPYKDLNIKQLFILIYWTILIKTNKATQTVENYFQVLKPEVYMHIYSMYGCMYVFL